MRLSRYPDYFSRAVLIYAACLWLTCKVLSQLSYIDGFSALSFLAYGLGIVCIVGLIWYMIVCLFRLMPLRFGSLLCTVPLILCLEFLSPNSLELYFWLHKNEYLARVAATAPSQDGRLSIILYHYTTYLPSMPGGYMCTTQIIYDNSRDMRLVAETDEGRGALIKVDDNFYFRSPPCG